MSRSIWKGPFVEAHLLKKLESMKAEGPKALTKTIKTWSRRSTIIPQFVGFTFGVHNGRKFIPVKVKESMVGRKLGEFSPTRVLHKFAGDKKAKKS